ncbi:MAG TPA: S8/S53 family peptidase [Thermoanaerobaculia bacterium]|nr:S8/S53 family peptidase [Thermoanaerobaculia bacterium]
MLLFLILPALVLPAAEVAPGVHTTGEFLISVRQPSALRSEALTRAGWSVQPLVTLQAYDESNPTAAPREKTWVLVTPPAAERATGEHPWDLAHRHASKTTSSLSFLRELEAADIVEIEPVAAYEMRGFAERFKRKSEHDAKKTVNCGPAPGGYVVACQPASFQWPNVKRMSWHLDDDRTELRKAQERTAASFETSTPVRIAHLDTGYYPTSDFISPKRFNTVLSRSMIPDDRCGESGIDCYQGGTPNGHGPETLSVLAGGRVRFAAANGYPGYEGYVGGAPLAEVFTLRVSPSVVLLYPLHVGRGIFDALDKKADVISMSMGGAPSYFLRDAVNAAYDRGTPMFFAAADFFHLPIPILSIDIPPHTMVYPARFSTATPVSGITASGRSYGLNPSWFLSVLRGDLESWALRGSYGPAHLMKDHALTAVSPNITSRWGTSAFLPNQVKLGFDGTSAATPQAAAAAALWLQFHRRDFTDAEWRSWVKTEAAYAALLQSARLPEQHRAVERFGAGLIQANRALDVPKGTPVKRPPGTIGVDWITLLAPVLKIFDHDTDPGSEEARLHQNMLRLEVAQLLTTEPKLRGIVNGDFEHAPTAAQIEKLARALQRHPRASAFLKAAIGSRR